MVLADSRTVEFPESSILTVDYSRYCQKEYFDRSDLYRDWLVGLLGGLRPSTARLYIPAIEALAATTVDAVFVHEGFYATTALPLWRRAMPGTPIYLYVHNSLSRSILARELRQSLACSDAVVCVSEFMADHVNTRSRGCPVPIVPILNGVDTDLFTPASNGFEGFRVLFVGRVGRDKGVSLLLKALLRARHAIPKLSVRIVGSGVYGEQPSLTPFEVELRHLGEPLGDRLEFVPFVNRQSLPSHYRWASVVCVPSIFDEPCGLVMLEAMACGVPVISSGRGGMREVGGSTAIYVDPFDEAEFASTLVALSNAPEEGKRLGESARIRAESLSSAAQYNQLMDSLGLSTKWQ